jgi:hypothetical protein
MTTAHLAKRAFDAIWFLLATTLGLSTLVLVLAVFMPPTAVPQLGIPVSFDLDLEPHGVNGGLIRNAYGTLSVPVARSPFLFANIAGLIVALGLGLWVLSQLRALFATVCEGTPFLRANIRRIRIVGLAVLLGEGAFVAIGVIENAYARTAFAVAGLRVDLLPPVNVLAILCGLFILSLAEVFKAGMRLDEEQSLTI